MEATKAKHTASDKNQNPAETSKEQVMNVPEKTMFEWEAPSRPFKKRDRRYFATIATIIFVLAFILLFAGAFLPIAFTL